MPKRASYLTIRDEFLLLGFQYCADKFQNAGILPWETGESEWLYTANQLAEKYQIPIEKMMLSVTAVIANAGRIEAFHNKNISYINDFFNKHNLDSIIDNLYTEPDEYGETEKEIFPYDLKRSIENQEILTPERYGELQRRQAQRIALYEEKIRKEKEQERLRQERYEQLQQERILRRLNKKRNFYKH